MAGSGSTVILLIFAFLIKNNKIWLEQNNTHRLVAEELVKAGVPREDIVLAIHPPYVRPHTGFATE